MSGRKIGLVLPVGRLWVMSLPFRLLSRGCSPGFAPGTRNILIYESRRLWHRIFERERLLYLTGGIYTFFCRKSRRR